MSTATLRRHVSVVAACAVTGLAIVASLVLAWPWSTNDQISIVVGTGVMGIAFVVSGALIAMKQPQNSLGRVLMLVGVFFALLGISGGPKPPVHGSELRRWTYTITAGFWAPPAFTLLSVVPLLFPTGKLPSPRWRYVIWLGAAGTVLTVALVPFDPLIIAPVRNPIANETLATVGGGATLLGVIAIVLAFVGMAMRFRRSTGVERDQLKLFVAASTVAALALVGDGMANLLVSTQLNPWLEASMLFTASSVLAFAIVYAILRHKLFDVNVVISKAIVYAMLAAFVTALYVGIVVGIGSLFGRGDRANVGLSVVATAIAALAFQPLRARTARLANRLVYGKRATPYEVLSQLSDQLRDTVANEHVLDRMVESLARGTGASEARVWMLNDDVLWTAASYPRSLPRLEIPASDGLPSPTDVTFAVPVQHAGESLGGLSITKPPSDPVTPTEERLVTDLGAQAGLVLRNARLTQELLARLDDLKASRQRLVKAQDSERRRIERNLHDGAQQQLVALKVQLGVLQNVVQDEAAKTMLGQLAEQTGQAIDDLRDLARGIYPPLLAAEGLSSALKAQAAKAVVPTSVETDGIARYAPEVEATVYFCVLEALQNIGKYSGASKATVSVRAADDRLQFEVIDDGRGFDPATTPRGAGLSNMADRLGALDGAIELISSPGTGTTLRGDVPAHARD